MQLEQELPSQLMLGPHTIAGKNCSLAYQDRHFYILVCHYPDSERTPLIIEIVLINDIFSKKIK